MPQRGAKGQVAPATPVHPQSPGDCESSISLCCPTCRAKEQEEEKGRCFPRGFFGGGIFPSAWLTRAQEAGEPLSYREG